MRAFASFAFFAVSFCSELNDTLFISNAQIRYSHPAFA